MGFWFESAFYAWELFKFMVFFYAVWAPGFVVAGLLACRFRYQLWNGMLARPGFSFGKLAQVIAAGIVGSAGRKATQETTGYLLGRGMPSGFAFAFLVASRNMTVHFWAVFALSLGAEFATGHILGTLVMIVVVTSLLCGLPLRSTKAVPPDFDKKSYLSLPGFGSWGELLFSLRGYLAVLKFFGQEVRRFSPSLVVGIGVGGVVFAAGLRRWWLSFADVLGPATVYSDFFNALAGALLGSLTSLSPVANLAVVHALFKTDGLGYPGIISFCLASVLHPKDVGAYGRLFGSTKAWMLVGVLYLGAVVGGVGSTWIYGLAGFRPSLPPVNLAAALLRDLMTLVGFY